MELQLNGTPIFQRNHDSKAETVINVGGAGSSKSYSILQLFMLWFLTKTGWNLLVTRKTGPALKQTAYRVFVDLLDSVGILERCEYNQTDKTIKYRGNYIAFLSIDQPSKIKSSEWNKIFMEEANEFTWADYIILKTRLRAKVKEPDTNQMFLAFNPDDEYGWIHQKLEPSVGVELIHSTYHDNPFLSKEYKDLLEGLAEQDPDSYKIFTLGEWATPTNLIYSNWRVVDHLPVVQDESFYGLDFGFNNPSALVNVVISDSIVYLDECLYESKLTNSDLLTRVGDVVSNRGLEIYADCAEPQRIEEFKRAGFNVKESDKVVRDGIDNVKRHRLHITARSVNLIKEIRGYKWKQDKNGNIIKDEPVKFRDHLMDAMRYAIHTHGLRRGLTMKDVKSVKIKLLETAGIEGY